MRKDLPRYGSRLERETSRSLKRGAENKREGLSNQPGGVNQPEAPPLPQHGHTPAVSSSSNCFWLRGPPHRALGLEDDQPCACAKTTF